MTKSNIRNPEFSERFGFNKNPIVLQIDTIDKKLRIALWNTLSEIYWPRIDSSGRFKYPSNYDNINKFIEILWKDHLNRLLDDLNRKDPELYLLEELHHESYLYKDLRKYFFSCEWNRVYEFIEFIHREIPFSKTIKSSFEKLCNKRLENGFSAYRFINGLFLRITSIQELETINDSLSKSNTNDSSKEHLETAMRLFSNKKSPDYRNSIKESISAIEALCKSIANKNQATLGDALKILGKRHALHPALVSSFEKLYGYTSNSGGIRHALVDKDNQPDFDDAKFMLVVCSAFVNYLISKNSKVC